MTEAYGRQFTAQFGTEPLPAWVEGLSVFTDQELYSGYMRALSENREFVPNLSVLINYCRGGGEKFGEMEFERRCHRPFDELPPPVDLGEGRYLPPPEDTRTPDQHLSAMKTLLGIEGA